MTKKQIYIFFIFIIIFSSCGKKPFEYRSKTNFGNDWQFKLNENSEWENITIPHTNRIENLVVVNQFQGTTTYQKKFRIENNNLEKYIYFEGIMNDADIYLNGIKVANHQGGYIPFIIDVTLYGLQNVENTLMIKVRNVDNPEIPPGKSLKDLDFNYYGGIYRNVYLITKNKLRINNFGGVVNGVFVNFNSVSKQTAEGTILTEIRNDYGDKRKFKLKYILKHKGGQKFEFYSGKDSITSTCKVFSEKIEIPKPKLWSINNPNLYQLTIQVISDDKILDTYTENIGIRKSEIRKDGYYLNDEKLFISGTNRHQEYPYLGYAISDEAQYRDAVKIKNAGFDFVRLSHYPQAEAFLKACDELGLLVMNSLTGWQFFGNQKFQTNSMNDLREMVRRDRNHPSVVFWENSLNETQMTERFMEASSYLLNLELNNFPHISASWIDNENYDLFIPARQHAKSPDYWTKYDKGNRKIFIAEYGDWEYYAQNAGFNQKDFGNLKEDERTSRQLRAFGEKRLLQQAYNFQEASNSNRKGKNTIGEANWLMFDYNRGYSPDIESSGISDIFRLPKFAYYFYQSQRDASIKLDPILKSGPMADIATYWNEKSPLDIRVYSNCDEVALYLDDQLIAKQKPLINDDSDALKHAPFVFSLDKFKAGTLRADGFINGKLVTKDIVKSPLTPANIQLSYDLSSIKISEDHPDVLFIYAKIIDKNGTVVPDATNEVRFSIEGKNAKLIGQNPIKAEAGIATIVLRTDKFKKAIVITAKSENMEANKITIDPKSKKRFF